jgi:hypothetical protein
MSTLIDEPIIAFGELDFPLLDNLPLFSFLSNQQTPNKDYSSSDCFEIPDSRPFHVPDSENEKKKLRTGRKRKHQITEGEKIHDKNATDNVLRKIHVHYMTFIITTVNELLNYLGYKFKFIDIDYNNKKVLTKKRFSLLKRTSIGQILCQKVSPKFRKQSKENLYINNIIFNQVKENKIIKYFLSHNYITVFKDVYLKDKRYFNENDVKLQFSENVKTYENLLNKIKKYDDKDEYEKKINEVIQKYFLAKQFKVKNN